MVKSWPEFYADYDGTNCFWKFWDLDQVFENSKILENFVIKIEFHQYGFS